LGLRQKVQIPLVVSSLFSSRVSFLKGSVHSSLTFMMFKEADAVEEEEEALEFLELDLDL
jgi:hypothetical protein